MGREAEQSVVSARGLTKRYREVLAVDGLDLSVDEGEVFGFLGPNGAGKTTTILMLLGLTEPTAGSVEVAGHDPVREPLAVKSVVGYLPENVGFYPDLTGRQNLSFTARLNGIPRRVAEERMDALFRHSPRYSVEPSGEAQILTARKIRIEAHVLRKITDYRLHGQRLPHWVVPRHFHTSRGGLSETEQHEYGGGFARTIRTQEAKNLTLIHTEIQTIHSQHLAVAFGQAPGGDDTLFCFTSHASRDVKQNRVSSPPGA